MTNIKLFPFLSTLEYKFSTDKTGSKKLINSRILSYLPKKLK